MQIKGWHMSLSKHMEEKAYTIAEHSGNPKWPSCLVAKRIKESLSTEHLDSQQVIILHQAQQQFIWKVLQLLPADLLFYASR